MRPVATAPASMRRGRIQYPTGVRRMAQGATTQPAQIDRFFAGPGARGDQWRDLVEAAEAWAGGTDNRAKIEAAFADVAVTEGFHAYPGAALLSALRDCIEAGDARGTAALARRITRALLTRSFR